MYIMTKEDIHNKSFDRKILFSSSNMICASPFHNRKSPAIISTVFNITCQEQSEEIAKCYQNLAIVNEGTIVYREVWQCDGNIQCFEDIDELHCGFDTFYTIFIGDL